MKQQVMDNPGLQANLLDFLYQHSNEGLAVFGNAGEWIYHNQRFLQIWGVPADILADRSWDALRRFINRQSGEPLFVDGPDGGFEPNPEMLCRLAYCGDERAVEVRCHPLQAPDETRLGWLWHFRDVTADRQVELTELHQRIMMEHLPAGVILTRGRQASIAYQNHRFELMFGYARGELSNLSDFWRLSCKDPAYREWIEQEWQARHAKASLDNAEIIPLEANLTAKGGKVWCIRIHATLVDGLNFISFYDLTKRRHAREELFRKTLELDTFFRVSMDLLCIANNEGKFLRLNPAWQETLGFSEQELQSKRYYDFIHPDDLEMTKTVASRLAYGQEARNFINRYRCRDGSYRWLEWQAYPLGTGVYAAARDITERKRAEDELAKHREHLTEMVQARTAELDQANQALREASDCLTLATQAASMGVWELDFSNGLVTWDDKMFQIYGLPKTLPLPHETWKQAVHPLDFAKVWASLQQTVEDKSFNSVEFRITHQETGQTLWIAAAHGVLLNGQGEVTKLVGTNTDITARKLVEAELRHSEAHHRFLTETMKDVVWVLDTETMHFRYHSPSVERLWGFTQAEVMVKPALVNMPKPVQAYLLDQIQRRVADYRTGKTSPENYYTLEFAAPHKDGHAVWVESISRCHLNEETGHIEIVGVTRDITERKQAELKLKNSETRFRAFFERPLVGMGIANADTQWQDVNDQLCEMLDYSRDQLLGKTLDDITHPEDKPANRKHLQQLMSGGIEDYTITKRCLRRGGKVVYTQTSASCIRKPGGSVDYLVVLVVDITPQHEAQEQLRQAAHHDALTLLPNRRLLIDRLQQAVAKARRHGGILAVCYLDLDGFKAINDSLGHAGGDQLLIEVAKRLKSCVRSGDTVSRLGGDEFVILLCSVTGEHECKLILNRLLKKVSAPYELADGKQCAISTSIGVALFPKDDAHPEILLRHADQALYAAKQAGRNRLSFFDGLIAS